MAVKISITGHRKLEDSEEVRNQVALAITAILEEKNVQHFEAYTSLATGSDSIFAEEAIKLSGQLKVVLPMPVAAYLHDFDSSGKIIFNTLISNDPNPYVVSDKIPKNNEERNNAYLKAGECIVNNCDVLIAVWDGEKSGGKGGTADIVDYARKIGKPVKHITAFRSDISRMFIQHDKPAIKLKTRYQRLWKTSIAFSLIAAIILAVSISFKLENIKYELAFVELACILLAVGIILYLKQGKLNKERIRTRRIAERLRVLERFNNSDINIEKLDNFDGLPDDVINLEKKYKAIVYPHINFEKSRKNLLQLVEDQIYYHTYGRPEIKSKTFHYLEKLQFPLLIVFFFGVVFHFLHIAQEYNQFDFIPHFPAWLGLLLSLSIPPVYAAIEGYIYFKEYHKIFIDSEKMRAFFNGMKSKIELIDAGDATNFEKLDDYAFIIMKNMDDETKEWVFIMETKKSPGP